MPQIWMTYREIAGLLGCDSEEARAEAAHRSLDRKKSRDGLTRVKLDLHWTAQFIAAIRETDLLLDQAIRDLQIVGSEMAGDSGRIVSRKAISDQLELPVKSRL